MVWLRGTGKLYDNSKNVLDSEKNTPSFFLINYRRCLIPTRYLTTQVTTVLQYSSELQSKLTRKLFSRFSLFGNLGKTSNNETNNNAKKKRQQQQKGKETRTCYEVTKVKVEVHVPLFQKSTDSHIHSRKSTFLGGGREGGDSKGRVINKKHTMLG